MNNKTFEERLLRLLPRVEKPGRYIGGEWNEVRKDPDPARLTVALAFPDVYEIGMSYLGQKILYDVLNSRPDISAERVFAPWPDMEAEMRRTGVPLLSLETKTPLGAFDLIGFSLLYELNDTNILTMLDLAGVPLRAGDRGPDDPLVIAGGPAAFNPEPLAEFFDAFFLGDGEEAFLEMAGVLLSLKRSRSGREEKVEALSRLAGAYVPSLYLPAAREGSRLMVPEPRRGAPSSVAKRVILDLPTRFPERIIVPHVQAVFDRVALEVARGCPQRCRFCQASSLYFPHRVRASSDIVHSAVCSLRATGYEDASLSALSVGDYPGLRDLVTGLMAELEREGVSLSLSSLRPQSLSPEVAASIVKVRKTGFTLVPEAGTERLRRVINKDLRDEDIIAAAENAFGQGWRLLKLYFMIGLPTEREEDIRAIESVVRAVLDAGRRVRNAPPRIHVSVSSFIPKPHTPFQWMAMETPEVLREKMRLIQGLLKRYRTVELKIHDLETSILEAVFSRGDRRLGPVLLKAWRDGARFDSWRDFFNFERWERALTESGLEAADYTGPLEPDSALPWDIVDTGLSRDHLRGELAKALRGEPTPPCSKTACGECQGCRPELRPRPRAGRRPNREFAEPDVLGAEANGVKRYRAFFSKTGPARFLSHNDLANCLRRAFRRAGIPILRSEGFHPKMMVSYLPALPLGMSGLEECLDLRSRRDFGAEEFLGRMNRSLPRGIEFLDLRRLGPEDESLGASLEGFRYSLDCVQPEVREAIEAAQTEKGLASLSGPDLLERLARDAFPGVKAAGFSISVEAGPPLKLFLEIAQVPSGSLRPQDLVRVILPSLEHPACFMARENVRLRPAGQIDNPS